MLMLMLLSSYRMWDGFVAWIYILFVSHSIALALSLSLSLPYLFFFGLFFFFVSLLFFFVIKLFAITIVAFAYLPVRCRRHRWSCCCFSIHSHSLDDGIFGYRQSPKDLVAKANARTMLVVYTQIPFSFSVPKPNTNFSFGFLHLSSFWGHFLLFLSFTRFLTLAFCLLWSLCACQKDRCAKSPIHLLSPDTFILV